MRWQTWHFESAVVAAILIVPFFFQSHIRTTEIIAALAVFMTFQHAVISDRMQERQAALVTPDVECYWKSNWYFMAKEALWITFFFMTSAWAALLGAFVFFCYPFWRKWYRKRYPLDREKKA